MKSYKTSVLCKAVSSRSFPSALFLNCASGCLLRDEDFEFLSCFV